MTNRTRQSMTVTLDHELLKKIDERVAALSPPGGPARTRSWVVEQLLLSALGETPLEPAKESIKNPREESPVEEHLRKLAAHEGLSVETMKEVLLSKAFEALSPLPPTFLDWMLHEDGPGSSVADSIEKLTTLGWQAFYGTHEEPPWRTPTYVDPERFSKRKFTSFAADPKFFQKP